MLHTRQQTCSPGHTARCFLLIITLNHIDLHSSFYFHLKMSETTFHSTKEDVREAESDNSKKNRGNVPAKSDPSLLKVSYPSDDSADDR